MFTEGGPVLTVPGRPFGSFGEPIHAFEKAFKYPASLKLSGINGASRTRWVGRLELAWRHRKERLLP